MLLIGMWIGCLSSCCPASWVNPKHSMRTCSADLSGEVNIQAHFRITKKQELIPTADLGSALYDNGPKHEFVVFGVEFDKPIRVKGSLLFMPQLDANKGLPDQV